jgi:hypothetical protein
MKYSAVAPSASFNAPGDVFCQFDAAIAHGKRHQEKSAWYNAANASAT